MTKIAIHQPCYIPYLGIFYKIYLSDKFVFLNDAQYSNGYVFDWNRIKTPQGECRLKVPTERKFGDLLTEVRPKYELGWVDRHLKTIEMNYKRAQHFDEVFPLFESCIRQEYDSLAALNIATMELFIRKFGWHTHLFTSEPMALQSRSESRVIDICRIVGGGAYLSGEGGREYQDEEHFADAGIMLVYPAFDHIPYRQLWGTFRPYMSVLDYAMNEGFQIDDYFDTVARMTVLKAG